MGELSDAHPHGDSLVTDCGDGVLVEARASQHHTTTFNHIFFINNLIKLNKYGVPTGINAPKLGGENCKHVGASTVKVMTDAVDHMAQQKAMAEVKAITQSNEIIQLLNEKDPHKRINSRAQEEAYKQAINDPLTEPYRKEAQNLDDLMFRGDDVIIEDPDMSRVKKYFFDESQIELGIGAAAGTRYMRKDGEIEGIRRSFLFDVGQSEMEAANIV